MVSTEYVLSAPAGSALLRLPEPDAEGSAWAEPWPPMEPPNGVQPDPQRPPGQPPEREPVRIVVYGSPQAVEYVIKWLHVVRFEEQFRWNSIRPIPENGIHIGPQEGEAYSFLLKVLRLQ
jgi:hypothetical protein